MKVYASLMAEPRRSKITELRRESGMKRSELAEKIGISYAAVYNIETGWRTTSVERLYRIAAALDVPIDDVMVRADNGHSDKAVPR